MRTICITKTPPDNEQHHSKMDQPFLLRTFKNATKVIHISLHRRERLLSPFENPYTIKYLYYTIYYYLSQSSFLIFLTKKDILSVYNISNFVALINYKTVTVVI